MKNIEKIILVGGGGHCKSCIDVIESEGKFQIAGIVDVEPKLGSKVLGYEICWTDKDLSKLVAKNYCFLITVGQIKNVDLRVNLFNELKKMDAVLPVIVAPTAYVSSHAVVSEGTVIMHHSIINAAASIGKNCIINSNSLIEHDAFIEDFCHISTGAIVNGGAVIGKKSFIGSNSVIVQEVKVESSSFIRAHSLIK